MIITMLSYTALNGLADSLIAILVVTLVMAALAGILSALKYLLNIKVIQRKKSELEIGSESAETDEEIVAVITAAIMVYCQEEPTEKMEAPFKIKSIRRKD